MSDYIYLDHMYEDKNSDLLWSLYYQVSNGSELEDSNVSYSNTSLNSNSEGDTIKAGTTSLGGYKLITKGIWSDDPLSADITNEYESDSDSIASDWSGKVGQVTNMIKSATKYRGTLTKAGKFTKDIIDMATLENEDTKWYKSLYNSVITGLSSAVNNIAQDADSLMKSALNKMDSSDYLKGITTGNYITTIDAMQIFKGSKVSMNLPKLETRLWDGVPISGKNPIEQLTWIIEKVVGDDPDKSLVFGGIQQSPNKYMARYADYIDNDSWNYTKQPVNGSYAIKLGDRLIISNLVVTSFNFTYSKLYTKRGNYEGPLYIDVTIDLDHAFYQGKQNLLQLITNGGNYSNSEVKVKQ